jgi:hypothetical protein
MSAPNSRQNNSHMSASDRFFFHTFPRPKQGEPAEATLSRAVSILRFMKDAGLVLAPEIVTWEIGTPDGGKERLEVLQQRACFTELALNEIDRHAATFGPITLSFNIDQLREAGATPVIYVPQGYGYGSPSQIGVFCAKAAWHTKYVLERLQELRLMSDPELAVAQFGRPLAENATFTLTNTDPAGKVVASYIVPAGNINAVMKYIGHRNIPFDHSIGMLSIFLNMFYPTDNRFSGELLGYYRQREWRLIGGGLNLNGRPIARNLTAAEVQELMKIDPQFWSRQLTIDGKPRTRAELACLYQPLVDWSFFDLVQSVFVPHSHQGPFQAIAGEKVKLY